jgi:hypothetical protein
MQLLRDPGSQFGVGGGEISREKTGGLNGSGGGSSGIGQGITYRAREGLAEASAGKPVE